MKHETLYLCDPEKNVKCGKQSCYAVDEPCYCTKNKDYALCVEGAPIVVTILDREVCLKDGSKFIAQFDIATKAAIKRYNLYLKRDSGEGLFVRESTGKNG